jgi:hypothetical protein
VQVNPGITRDPVSKITKRAGHWWLAHACNPGLLRRQRSGGWRFEASTRQIVHEILSQKKKKTKKTIQNRAGRVAQVAQVVDCLPRKCKALSSTSSVAPHKK